MYDKDIIKDRARCFFVKPVYERLFDRYCDTILQENDSFDEYRLEQQTAFLSLDTDQRRKLMDLFLDLHQQWALDGFAVGLHLGLSLLPPDSVGGAVPAGTQRT